MRARVWSRQTGELCGEILSAFVPPEGFPCSPGVTQQHPVKKKKNTSLCVKTRCCHHHTQFSFLRSSEMCFGGLHLRTCEKPGTHRRGAKNSGLNDFPLIRCLKVNDSGRINDTSAHVGSCFFPSDPCFFFFFL